MRLSYCILIDFIINGLEITTVSQRSEVEKISMIEQITNLEKETHKEEEEEELAAEDKKKIELVNSRGKRALGQCKHDGVRVLLVASIQKSL